MMRNRFTSRFLALALLGVVCAMPAVCAQRDVDLTAADGTKLKATYFDAGKPGHPKPCAACCTGAAAELRDQACRRQNKSP